MAEDGTVWQRGDLKQGELGGEQVACRLVVVLLHLDRVLVQHCLKLRAELSLGLGDGVADVKPHRLELLLPLLFLLVGVLAAAGNLLVQPFDLACRPIVLKVNPFVELGEFIMQVMI